jgi:hypothetical protein
MRTIAAAVIVFELGFAAPTLAIAACSVSSNALLGAWAHTNQTGFFEQMEFTSDGKRNSFNSWLHDRPEISGATWSLQNCVLRISNPTDPSLSFVYSASMRAGQRLELREAGQPVARYRRIKE